MTDKDTNTNNSNNNNNNAKEKQREIEFKHNRGLTSGELKFIQESENIVLNENSNFQEWVHIIDEKKKNHSRILVVGKYRFFF